MSTVADGKESTLGEAMVVLGGVELDRGFMGDRVQSGRECLGGRDKDIPASREMFLVSVGALRD